MTNPSDNFNSYNPNSFPGSEDMNPTPPPTQQPQYQQPQYQQPQYQQPQYQQPQYQQPQPFPAPMPQQVYIATGYPTPPAGSAPKSAILAAALAFFFGMLGIHNFYLGHIGRGTAQALLTMFGVITAIFLFGFLFLGAVETWAFIEFIVILCSVNKIEQRY